jgi:hypothetical protein
VPTGATLDHADRVIERCCATVGLRIASRGTLNTYPGSIHWHLKKGSQPGTLEATYWPSKRRIWLAIHANRAGPWIADAVVHLSTEIERQLGATA